MSKYSVLLILFVWSGLCAADDVNLDQYQSLVSDTKSYHVGEPVIVMVVETTTAEASAGTGVKKNTNIGAGVSTKHTKANLDFGVDGNDDGSGKTTRTGRVATQLSTTITEVLPQGMLRIRGVQDITINGERQTVTVSGIIKARDISKNNSIFSYQIAEAVLDIAGDGALTRAQKQNIFYRFFSWLGLL